MKFLFVLTLLFSHVAYSAANDVCDFLQIKNCRGVTKQLRRTSFSTSPSTSTAASTNPANVSFDRGGGLDVIYQGHNPLLFGISSGTGKMGGALISGSIENSFFGNRAPELIEALNSRFADKTQYRNKKLTFALGAKLVAKKNAALDVGVILKRHPMVKKINPGFGVSGRLWRISFGASFYKDDYYIDLTKTNAGTSGISYADILNKKYVQGSYTVTTYTVGTRLWNFALDYGMIKSHPDFYEKESVISIYSASYHYNNLLLHLALRNEESDVTELQKLDTTREDPSKFFTGVQYSVNDHIVLGVNYNYFLLNEVSFTATIFI